MKTGCCGCCCTCRCSLSRWPAPPTRIGRWHVRYSSFLLGPLSGCGTQPIETFVDLPSAPPPRRATVAVDTQGGTSRIVQGPAYMRLQGRASTAYAFGEYARKEVVTALAAVAKHVAAMPCRQPLRRPHCCALKLLLHPRCGNGVAAGAAMTPGARDSDRLQLDRLPFVGCNTRKTPVSQFEVRFSVFRTSRCSDSRPAFAMDCTCAVCLQTE